MTNGTEGQDQTPELTDGRTMFFIATDIFGNVYYSRYGDNENEIHLLNS